MTERWIELGRAATPQGDELVLRRRGDAYDIRFNGWEAMSSRSARSENALARLACQEFGKEPRRILIGGLGMGYTLRAALDLAADARIVVCELVPAVVDWVRGPLAHLAEQPLGDPRVEIIVGDVAELLDAERDSFDIILLDTDNGPDSVLRQANQSLYGRDGVALVSQALTPGGIVGVWSADRSAAFEETLSMSDARWRRVEIDARGDGRGPEHSLYLVRPM